MTITMLLENTIAAAERSAGIDAPPVAAGVAGAG
jgi:hypothetical protein